MAGGGGEAEAGYQDAKAADAEKSKKRKERKEAERAAKKAAAAASSLPAGESGVARADWSRKHACSTILPLFVAFRLIG